MTNKRFLSSIIGVVFCLVIGFFIPQKGNCATSKTPLVAMEPLVSEPASINYVGKALSKMFLTRLSSEGIDTVLVGGAADSDLMSVADFVITGKVVKVSDHYEASFELKSPKDGTIIKQWNLKASNLGVLAKDAALLSAKISDTVKNTGEVLVANTVSDFAALAGPDSKKIKASDEFALARLHPDILVREKLEKDELKEIEQQRKKIGTSRTVRRQGEDVEGDSFMPLPDVYDVGDDAPEDQNVENEQGSPKSASVSSEEDEDDSSFMPIPDVYDPDDDEDAVEKPKSVEISSGMHKHEELKSKGAGEDKSNKKGKGSWYSWLWPFGNNNQNDSEAKLVSQAKETRLQKEESDKEPIVISSTQKLPVPPPPNVRFEIPEPVPLDEALSKIENIKVERKEEKGWFSRLWPWTEEESGEVIQQRAFVSQGGSKGQAVAKQEESLQTFDSGSQINAIRRHMGMETGQPHSTMQIQPPSTPDVNPKGQEEGATITDSGQIKRSEQVEGPIWQWN